ncbi:hypothetical protein B0H10DRAFT_1102268 [Mycena sp. CBHHK59/15]|nr:hypothetical protein B0H10DRAFT_1102268 [Mycena sp. CBHHK59/15]
MSHCAAVRAYPAVDSPRNHLIRSRVVLPAPQGNPVPPSARCVQKLRLTDVIASRSLDASFFYLRRRQSRAVRFFRAPLSLCPTRSARLLVTDRISQRTVYANYLHSPHLCRWPVPPPARAPRFVLYPCVHFNLPATRACPTSTMCLSAAPCRTITNARLPRPNRACRPYEFAGGASLPPCDRIRPQTSQMSAYKARPSPTQSTPTPAPRHPPARVSSRSDHLVRYAFVAPPLALLSRDGVCFTRRLAAASCAPSPQHIVMRDASGLALSPAVPASASRLLRIPAPCCCY